MHTVGRELLADRDPLSSTQFSFLDPVFVDSKEVRELSTNLRKRWGLLVPCLNYQELHNWGPGGSLYFLAGLNACVCHLEKTE